MSWFHQQGVAGSTVLCALPSLLQRLLPTTQLSRYNAAKRGATIITGTANRKALGCLSGQPGLPGTCEAQQEQEKRKRAGAVRGKPRLRAGHAPYHAVGWFAGMCLHLLPVLLGFLHDIFVGHSWEKEGADGTELPLFNQQKRGREGLQVFPHCGLGIPV